MERDSMSATPTRKPRELRVWVAESEMAVEWEEESESGAVVLLATLVLLGSVDLRGVGAVEEFRVAFLSREEERRAVSLACRSVAMRWASGTSSMRRKSRVEAATWGWRFDEASVFCDVVVAMVVVVCACV
jgi:hypothetical protein